MQIPEEVEKIDEKLEHLARVMEDTVDLDGILELARNVSAMQEDTQVKEHLLNLSDPLQKGIQIATEKPGGHAPWFLCVMQNKVSKMRLIGIEPTHAAPEATALSTELQTHL